MSQMNWILESSRDINRNPRHAVGGWIARSTVFEAGD